MKKLLSTVLALSASLFFGLLLTGCSYFDFVGGGTKTVVEKEVVTETVIVTEKETIYDSVLKACSCWTNANGVVEDNEMTNTTRYKVEVVKEHRADASGNIVNGSYLIKCTKCTWTCTYEGAMHSNLKTVVEGDCKVGAYERTRCSDCSLILDEKSVTVEHTYPATPNETKAATCVAKGSKLFKCTVCGNEKTESIPVDSDNHSFSTTPSSTTSATCTKAGTQTFKCTRSGCTKTKTVNNANDPARHPSTTTVNVTEFGSTFCTDGGYVIEKCTTCKEIISQTPFAPLGHTVLMEEVADDPTVTEDMIGWTLDDGLIKGFCSVCRKTATLTLPAWEDLTDYIFEYDCVNSTITYKIYIDGKGTLYATAPENTLVNEFTITQENATPPHMLNGVLMTQGGRYPTSLNGITELVSFKATCSADGDGYFICQNCEKSIGITTYVEHTHETIAYEGKEPTCSEKGLGYAYCTECKITIKENIEIPKLGHTYNKVAYVPVVEYNPEKGEWTAYLQVPCLDCDNWKKSTAITITASKNPTCTSSGYATYEYIDYNGETITETILLYVADGTTPEGHGHNEDHDCTWSWYNEETGNTHYYTGYACPYCEIRFIETEVIKDANGNVIQTITYPVEE